MPSVKNVVREICISSCEGKSFSNPKGEVCECSGNNIKLSECKRDISRHVQTHGLGINRDEISDEMDLILELSNVRTVLRYRYTHTKKKGTHSLRAKNADCTLYLVNEK